MHSVPCRCIQHYRVMLCKCVYEVDLNTSSADVNDACGGEGECIQGSGD